MGAIPQIILRWITFLGTQKHILVRFFVGDEVQFRMLIVFLHTDAQLQFWTSGPAGANNTFPKNSLVRPFYFRLPYFPDKILELV